MNDQQLAEAWLEDFFSTYYRLAPVNATFIGVHQHDHRLPDCSGEGLAAAEDEIAALLVGSTRFGHDALDPVTRLDVELATGYLEIQQWEMASRHFQRGNPCYYTGEAIFGVMSLFLREFAPLEQRLDAAAARLKAIPALLEQARTNAASSHPAWIDRAVRECDGAIAFLEDGLPLIDTVGDLVGAAASARQAFQQYRAYLQSSPASDADFDVACGSVTFNLLMQRGHIINTSACEILEYAEDQAQQAESRLAEDVHLFGESDWRNVLPQLQEFHPETSEYYDRYYAMWQKCREACEASDLLTWPDYPIRYVPRPEWSRAAAPNLYFLFYRSPAPFDDVPVVDYLVTPVESEMPEDVQRQLLRANNDSVIKLNHVIHHGSIGHHVQNWHAFRAESRIGRIASVDCASRIALFCGGTMAEGWSSYTTELMSETDFLTPLERYSQHHTRLRMAVRAIVDVRLHHRELTIDQAAALYNERVGMPVAAARDEAVKNSMFPGAAMIYLIGTDMIHQLRQDLAAQQGAAFSLRAFHDSFLSHGSIPVAMIDSLMRSDVAQ